MLNVRQTSSEPRNAAAILIHEGGRVGYLRTYLALCVIAAHSNDIFPWSTHDGRQAVQIFFCISGFYMAMIISGRYRSVREFYISRWLRIFGPYYAILIMVILWSTVCGLLFGNWLSLTAYASLTS